eukprot:CAMPEP_0170568854 /NCGR_PEP_ID=MMETSP0224-20130122/198_1 /TAXON_ID=285029 /ORGANISM="Togula jolla, Strain CCCM 725" /LENGTH=63 /DNA_ID=CAMNT_0010890891 /DNA_START=487 /DNA_END=678 /DNA_ORIENTATION=-
MANVPIHSAMRLESGAALSLPVFFTPAAPKPRGPRYVATPKIASRATMRRSGHMASHAGDWGL